MWYLWWESFFPTNLKEAERRKKEVGRVATVPLAEDEVEQVFAEVVRSYRSFQREGGRLGSLGEKELTEQLYLRYQTWVDQGWLNLGKARAKVFPTRMTSRF